MTKKNYLYNSFYQILLIIIPLITTPYISRVLGASKIGLYSYSYAIAYYFVMFIMLGLNNYGNRTVAYVRDDKDKLSKTFFEIYFMQIMISFILIVIYIFYTLFFSNNIITWIMTIYVISAALDINWFFFGIERFKITVIRSSIIKILSTISIFLFIKKPGDIYIYSFINVISIFLSQLILWFYIKKLVYFKKASKKEILYHLKPNLTLFIPVVAISVYKMMDKIMLGAMSSLEQVGFYENTEKIIQVPLALITSLGTVMLPKISNLVAKKDITKSNHYLKKSVCFASLVSSSMCFGIMAVSKYFVPWYFGSKYEPCIMLLVILMPSCLFLSIANVIRTQFLIPYKHDKIYIISVVSGAVVNLIINLLLIKKMGSQGAAIGTLVAEIIVCTMQLVLIKKMINIKKIIGTSLKYVLFGTIMYAILIMIPRLSTNDFLNIVFNVAIGGIIYILLAFKFVKKDLLNNN